MSVIYSNAPELEITFELFKQEDRIKAKPGMMSKSNNSWGYKMLLILTYDFEEFKRLESSPQILSIFVNCDNKD